MHYPRRPLILTFSAIWKWRVDFILGQLPKPLATFVDMTAACTDRDNPGLRILGYSFSSWLRNAPVPVSRGQARPADVIKMSTPIKNGHQPKVGDVLGKKTKAQKRQEKKERQAAAQGRDDRKRKTQEYPPLMDDQAQTIFDICSDSDFPQICPVQLANLAYRGAELTCDGNCGCHHFGARPAPPPPQS